MGEAELGGRHERQDALPAHPLDQRLEDLILGRFTESFWVLVHLNARVPQVLRREELQGPGTLGEGLTLQALPQRLHSWMGRSLVNFFSGATLCSGRACGGSYSLLLFCGHWKSFHFNFGERLRQDLLHRDIFALEQLSN